MLQKLLVVLSLCAVQQSYAQQNGNVPAPMAQALPATIDYKQMGAPMPPLVITSYVDPSAGDTVTGNRKLSKKERKREADALIARQEVRIITDKDLKNNGNLLVMLFNPTCSHCQDMTMMFEKNISLFISSRLLMMATANNKEYLPEFSRRYHVANYPQILLGADSSGFIENVFLYQPLPQINIYDADRKLIKTFTGETPIDSLKKFIR